MKLLFSALVATDSLLAGITAEQCGRQAGGVVFPGGLCCNQFGYYGTTDEYCGDCYKSQCRSPSGDVASIITGSLFDQMLKHRNDAACQGRGFYTYDSNNLGFIFIFNGATPCKR